MIKLHKWKYQGYRKIILTHKKMARFLKRNSATIYDTRSSQKFYKSHLNGSLNISPIKIREAIKNQHTKKTIVLVHDFERANLNLVSWARWKGYKKIYIYHLTPETYEQNIFKMNRLI